MPPPPSEAPPDYAAWLADLMARIQQERLRVVLASNAIMVLVYWDIGRSILDKQADQGWGRRVIDRVAADLREAFPEMKGFSPHNLKYMRAFAGAWPERLIVQASLAHLTWYHHIALWEKVDRPESRLWYAARTLEHGWSRNILALQIEAQTHRRQSKAQTNFPATLPPPDSDMAVQVFKDPYLFDFLGTDAPRRETCATDSTTRHDRAMSRPETVPLNLPKQYLYQVMALLRGHVPQAEVWALWQLGQRRRPRSQRS